MKREEILSMFRQQASEISNESDVLNSTILELAQLLADSRGKLSKENFETLLSIGATLYKIGDSRFHAKSDVDAIMKQSLADEATDRSRKA